MTPRVQSYPARRSRTVVVARLRRGRAVPLWFVACAAVACAPVVREAPFAGARDQVTDVSLEGPFDGQVVDAATEDPIEGAQVAAVWSFDRGDGFIVPMGSETVELTTDAAGRYRVPPAPRHPRQGRARLVSFSLSVYKRGYAAYRSDATLEGGLRTDFRARQHTIRLEKWESAASHFRHLVFLAPSRAFLRATAWERPLANAERARGSAPTTTRGAGAAPARAANQPGTLAVLDARGLLEPEAVRKRTGFTDAFAVKELGDLTRTHFYHGVHFQAVDRDEAWDLSYRVWKNPPGGLEPVLATLRATLPGVAVSGDVTASTWVLDREDVRAVAFTDEGTRTAVLLTCGAKQCVDIETVVLLARLIYQNLGALKMVDPEAPAPTPNLAAPTEPPP